MLPVKKILCPIDFSEPSYEALETANEFAMHFNAELILVHVVPPVPVIPTSPAPMEFNLPSYQTEMESLARKSFDDLMSERVSEGVRASAVVVQGSPPDEIVKMAAGEKVDVIVIATHGLTGWQRFVFGSVAEKVVRLAACPVLSIHARSEQP